MPFLPKDLAQDELEEMIDPRHMMGGPAYAIYSIPYVLTSYRY